MPDDPLSDVLSLLKPQTYVAGGFDLRGRWSIGFAPHTGIKCYALLSGACWLLVQGDGGPVRLEEGECVLLPHGRPFALCSDPAMDPVPFDELQAVEWRGGLATLAGGGETVILGGHFAFAGPHADLLFGAMPAVARLRGNDGDDLRWALGRMRRELVDDRPGGVLVAQHLAHLMLVQALRLYLSGCAGRHVGWLFALAHPQLARAIAAIHAEPGARWTLPALAARAAMSRSSFARCFKSTVGVSPIDYLARWRMLLAAARLSDGNQAISVIARALGYDSESAFSTAFKRVMGLSPNAYRRRDGPAEITHPWPSTALARPSTEPGPDPSASPSATD